MLIRKKAIESKPTFTPPVNFLGLDAKLIKQFQKQANVLNNMQEFKVPRAVAEFVRYLVMSTDARELIHFAFLHSQRALYSTLREFIKLHMDKPSIPELVQSEFLDIASQFLTQAYCLHHEPINMWHKDNRWSYSISLDLLRVFRPFQAHIDQQQKVSSEAIEGSVYEE